jgi:hypothetical protein
LYWNKISCLAGVYQRKKAGLALLQFDCASASFTRQMFFIDKNRPPAFAADLFGGERTLRGEPL